MEDNPDRKWLLRRLRSQINSLGLTMSSILHGSEHIPCYVTITEIQVKLMDSKQKFSLLDLKTAERRLRSCRVSAEHGRHVDPDYRADLESQVGKLRARQEQIKSLQDQLQSMKAVVQDLTMCDEYMDFKALQSSMLDLYHEVEDESGPYTPEMILRYNKGMARLYSLRIKHVQRVFPVATSGNATLTHG